MQSGSNGNDTPFEDGRTSKNDNDEIRRAWKAGYTGQGAGEEAVWDLVAVVPYGGFFRAAAFVGAGHRLGPQRAAALK